MDGLVEAKAEEDENGAELEKEPNADCVRPKIEFDCEPKALAPPKADLEPKAEDPKPDCWPKPAPKADIDVGFGQEDS